MPPKLSSVSLQPQLKKQMKSMSKTELKISLLAKRLAMLQDDIDDHNPLASVAPPIHYQMNPTKVKTSRKLLFSRDSLPEDNCVSSPVKDIIQDLPTEDVIPISKPTKTKYTRRSLVISDDESEEDGNLQLLVQNAKKQRIKRKRLISADSFNNEIPKAVHNPKNRRIKIDVTSSTAMKRAEEVQAKLPAKYPSFVKLMLPSHVTRVFWLHLPTKFCKDHLPKIDSTVELVDENGKISECNYLVNKSGLSGGWRAFSLERELNEGDVVVFQLIESTKFKVYIIREGGQDEFEGALGLLTLDGCRGQEISEKRDDQAQMVLISEDSPPLNSESPSNSGGCRGQEISEKRDDQAQMVIISEDSPPLNSESPSNSVDHLAPDMFDGICFSNVAITFEAIKGFDNFSIIVDGLVLDSKFSNVSRKKYYELCCCHKSFLHEQLLKGLNSNLVIGTILDTITLADAIGTCRTSSISIEDLRIWDEKLKGIELLGMKVNFLRAKLNQMLSI